MDEHDLKTENEELKKKLIISKIISSIALIISTMGLLTAIYSFSKIKENEQKIIIEMEIPSDNDVKEEFDTKGTKI